MYTSFIDLTDMWHAHEYVKIGEIIRDEHWTAAQVAEFCAYFCKYMGTDQLKVLYKFL
jgi:hypothetical protein